MQLTRVTGVDSEVTIKRTSCCLANPAQRLLATLLGVLLVVSACSSAKLDSNATVDAAEQTPQTTGTTFPVLPFGPDPTLQEIANRALQALTGLGYDTSEGEAPSKNLITAVAQPTSDDGSIREWFMVTVNFGAERPFGPSEDSYTSEIDGVDIHYTTKPGASTRHGVWFNCDGAIVELHTVKADDQTLGSLATALAEEACATEAQ